MSCLACSALLLIWGRPAAEPCTPPQEHASQPQRPPATAMLPMVMSVLYWLVQSVCTLNQIESFAVSQTSFHSCSHAVDKQYRANKISSSADDNGTGSPCLAACVAIDVSAWLYGTTGKMSSLIPEISYHLCYILCIRLPLG